ncbi:efflux RND transporter periplasmic adaptor subunit [Rhizobium sp. C4]|uniref:efflux RND transporter periplasmic adaptor subunit n=1 Tax=Rhizobium sp. C4 TaxID=1349800 RepID=UPI001E49FB7E|nr:efflux RND transporter periplasmic adaptor subunit [Rhizobium sp. C4]MCD2171668.1 efflux RND transporter periplasmic adaptor subunit [Rhizobium sp. C4]
MQKTWMVAGLLALANPALAGSLTLQPTDMTEWKAVYGQVEAKDTVPARARIGGVITELTVTEGDVVKAGQTIAVVRDDKIDFQLAAYDAQLKALETQLANAQSELARGTALVGKGITTQQQLDQLKTSVDVLGSQIVALTAQRSVSVEQQKEGDVLAPANGRVLQVPVTKGAVIMGGEPVATIGGGGFFLRLAIPERHASALKQGASIHISAGGAKETGKLVKIYPEITNGRVAADVEVAKLNSDFVNARVLVEIPVATRKALLVPQAAIVTRSGIDFVSVEESGKSVERAVILGEKMEDSNPPMVEVLTGLKAGDAVVTPK